MLNFGIQKSDKMFLTNVCLFPFKQNFLPLHL